MKEPLSVEDIRINQFVEYLMQGHTQAEAARLAGLDGTDNSIHVKAHRLLRKAKTQARIRERLEQAEIDSNTIIGTLYDQMLGSMEDFLDFDPAWTTPRLNLNQARELGVLHLIQELAWTEHGPRIKLYSAKDAATQLSRILGLDKSRKPEFQMTMGQFKQMLAEARQSRTGDNADSSGAVDESAKVLTGESADSGPTAPSGTIADDAGGSVAAPLAPTGIIAEPEGEE